MDFDRPNAKIGQKMVNGRLLFLALHMYICTDIHTDMYINKHSYIYTYMCTYIRLTSSHLRSKEFISIHKPCIPHSGDTTKCTPVYIQM